jgi:hypothetical protein
MKKEIWILLIIALAIFAQAQTPVTPVSRTDKLIKEEHEATREWCKKEVEYMANGLEEKYQAEKNNLLKFFNQIMWFDRVFTAVGIFCIVIIGNSISNYFRRKHERSEKALFEQYLRKFYGGKNGN